MVAIVKTGYSIRRTFFYNEQKMDLLIADSNGVQKPAATLLMAGNYPVDLAEMSQQHRLNMLLKVAGRRPEVKRNSVHITLNFPPGEVLPDDRLRAIAEDYMQQIGFGEQPFLVYKHQDAGHPHIHIVSTKVRPNGEKIDMQNIGKNQSETARKDIEIKYNLLKAEEFKRSLFKLRAINPERAAYGHKGTKQLIGSTLEILISRYHYTSLTELNAVLNLYNIHADAGSENSRIRKNAGLVFRILDDQGKPVGMPVKASLLHFKPTLKKLEAKFVSGAKSRKQHADHLRSELDAAIRKHSPRFNFKTLLKRKGIDLLPRYSKEGRLYGITYVDHGSKCVFNGSDLGKAYSANTVAPMLVSQPLPQLRTADKSFQINPPPLLPPGHDGGKNLWEILTEPAPGTDYVPFELRPRRKRKRKNRPNNLTQ